MLYLGILHFNVLKLYFIVKFFLPVQEFKKKSRENSVGHALNPAGILVKFQRNLFPLIQDHSFLKNRSFYFKLKIKEMPVDKKMMYRQVSQFSDFIRKADSK